MPYNPHSTGVTDHQAAITTADGRTSTVYYLYFKNFNGPVLQPGSTEFYYPNVFKNTGDTTTISFAARPYMIFGNVSLFNSCNSVSYEQVVHWVNPEALLIEGLTNTTIDSRNTI